MFSKWETKFVTLYTIGFAGFIMQHMISFLLALQSLKWTDRNTNIWTCHKYRNTGAEQFHDLYTKCLQTSHSSRITLLNYPLDIFMAPLFLLITLETFRNTELQLNNHQSRCLCFFRTFPVMDMPPLPWQPQHHHHLPSRDYLINYSLIEPITEPELSMNLFHLQLKML